MKNDRKMTFLLMTIPVVVLFFLFNTLPLIKGVIYRIIILLRESFC